MKQRQNQIQKNTMKYFQRSSCLAHFQTNSRRFTQIDSGNHILFQIKNFSRNIKGSKLAMCLMKKTGRP